MKDVECIVGLLSICWLALEMLLLVPEVYLLFAEVPGN